MIVCNQAYSMHQHTIAYTLTEIESYPLRGCDEAFGVTTDVFPWCGLPDRSRWDSGATESLSLWVSTMHFAFPISWMCLVCSSSSYVTPTHHITPARWRMDESCHSLTVAFRLLRGSRPALNWLVLEQNQDRMKGGIDFEVTWSRPLKWEDITPVQLRFYDHVHTTGLDVQQAPYARAALTLGPSPKCRGLSCISASQI